MSIAIRKKRNKFQAIFSFDMKQSVDFVLFLHFLFFKCCWLNKYLRLYMPISLEEMQNNWNSISLHLNSFWSPLFKNVDLYTSWFRKLAYNIALLLILKWRKSLKSAFFQTSLLRCLLPKHGYLKFHITF